MKFWILIKAASGRNGVAVLQGRAQISKIIKWQYTVHRIHRVVTTSRNAPPHKISGEERCVTTVKTAV